MYLLLNCYKLFFINRAFHKDSFKIKTFVLFLFLDKVVNCSNLFFVLAILECPRGNLTSVFTSLLANSIVPRRAHGFFFFFFSKQKGNRFRGIGKPYQAATPYSAATFSRPRFFDSQAL